MPAASRGLRNNSPSKPKGGFMCVSSLRIFMLTGVVVAGVTAAGLASAGELDPKAISYTLPDKIQWHDNAAGTNSSAILYGDPTKAEPYAMLLRWKAGNMSRPHFHPNDRYFIVLSGTWWV